MKKERKSLAEKNPDLAKEWHPTKNGKLTPNDVTYSSGMTVWWYVQYYDAKTGITFPFEWQATINHRHNGEGCPFLNGRRIWVGFNDLESQNPELAAQWHPTKNGSLTPRDVTSNSHKTVWWFLPYYDPKTGHQCFEWQAKVDNRNRGKGCPFIAGQAVWKGYNDLATLNKELAAQWHPTKNGSLTPSDVTLKSTQKVWWLLPYDEPQSGRHFDFVWSAKIANRANGDGCPYLVNRLLWPTFNDLATIRPDIAEEWDFDKNNELTPDQIVFGSHRKVWWKCAKGHSWATTVRHRCCGDTGCPHCSKELKTSLPEQIVYYYMSQSFDDVLNGDKDAIGVELDVYIPTLRFAIEYDGCAWHRDLHKDIKKNIKCRDNGISLLRIREIGCPEMATLDPDCKVIEVIPGDLKSLSAAIVQISNLLGVEMDVDIDRDSTKILSLIEHTNKKSSLATCYPEIATQWHPTKNGNLKPDHVSAYSGRIVWWSLQYYDLATGESLFLDWQAAICDRTIRGDGCPYLSGHRVFYGLNDLFTLNPNLTKEWHSEKNKGLTNKKGEDISTPDKISPGSHYEVWWKCSICGHEWLAKVENRHRLNQGCPECYKNSRKPKTISQSDIYLSSDEKSA